MANQVIEALFKTNAVRVAPEDTPFWYTSGTLGPFYINTHFIIRDEATANDFLKKIETYIAEDKKTFPHKIFLDLLKVYEESETFKMITDLITATSVYSTENFEITKDSSEVDLKGLKTIHVADLITEASSYVRAWIPAIRGLGSDISNTVAVIDRHQNGEANLKELGVSMETFAGIDKSLFDEALSLGAINQQQYDLTMKFLADPSEYMASFLKEHPNFIKEQIALGGKAKERAELAISKGYASV